MNMSRFGTKGISSCLGKTRLDRRIKIKSLEETLGFLLVLPNISVIFLKSIKTIGKLEQCIESVRKCLLVYNEEDE